MNKSLKIIVVVSIFAFISISLIVIIMNIKGNTGGKKKYTMISETVFTMQGNIIHKTDSCVIEALNDSIAYYEAYHKDYFKMLCYKGIDKGANSTKREFIILNGDRKDIKRNLKVETINSIKLQVKKDLPMNEIK